MRSPHLGLALVRQARVLALIVAFVIAGVTASCQGASQVASDVPDLGLVEELRYPPSATEPLSNVRQIAPAGDGSILVIDGQTRSVLLFDDEGAVAATIGREGDGPGEFQSLFHAGTLGDTVWASDARLGRLSFFERDGSPIGDWSPTGFRYAAGHSAALPLALVAPSSVLLTTRVEGTADSIAFFTAGLGEEGPRPFTAINTSRRYWPLWPGSSSTLQQPLASFDLVRPWREGLVVLRRELPDGAPTPGYRVEWHSPEAETIHVDVPYRAHATMQADVDAALDVYARSTFPEQLVQLGRYGSVQEVIDAAREGLIVPEFLPPVRGGSSALFDTSVLVDPLGVVWAELWERTPEGDAQWDIIAQTGLQARVTVPADLRLLAAEGQTAWGVYTDDLGVPTIVRFRVLE